MSNGNYQTGKGPTQGSSNIGFRSEWIKNQIDADAIKFANDFGKKIKDGGLTTSQIRNVFGEMRRIQMKDFRNEISSFLLLKPKLAYAVKRNFNRGLQDFFVFFEKCYNAVDIEDPQTAEKQFKNFMHLMEAVLAYHKFHGGKE